MKTILQCDIDDNFSVLALLINESHNGSNQTGQPTISVRLTCKKNTDIFLASKTVPWPVDEPLPSEILYIDSEECVKLKNSTTVAQIPLRVRAIRHLGFQNNSHSEVTKKFKAFSANPKPISDYSSILVAVKAVLENPENTRKWKTLRKKLATANAHLAGVLTLNDQISLLEALKQRGDADELEELCTALKEATIFGFKCQESFINFCLDMRLFSVVDSLLDSPNALSEAVLAKFLKIATTKTVDEGKSMLESVLYRGFSERFMTESTINVLTSNEAALVIEWCAHIYQDHEKENISARALSLISVLIDAHGNRLIWDNDSHEKILDVIALVTDLTAMTDAFATYEAQRANDFSQTIDEPLLFHIHTEKLQSRTMVW